VTHSASLAAIMGKPICAALRYNVAAHRPTGAECQRSLARIQLGGEILLLIFSLIELAGGKIFVRGPNVVRKPNR